MLPKSNQAASDGASNALSRLILEPVETLEVEYKNWLDLKTPPHKAKLAKELIALANHGGGHVVLGFTDPQLTPVPRPPGYEYVTTDYINGIVAAYADPMFHCNLTAVGDHLVISVSPGATVPIRSKKGAANNEIIGNCYYTRRPGPNSEAPQSGLEWDALLRRCIANRDAELEVLVRRVVRVMSITAEEMPIDGAAPIDKLLK